MKVQLLSLLWSKTEVVEKLKKFLSFILNPRLIVCLALAWLITNGWSYILFVIGTYSEIPWMIGVSSAYLAFLWLPVSPEKLFTVALAIVFLRFLFPNDTKTLAVLRDMHKKLVDTIKKKKAGHSEKKRGSESGK